MKLIPTIFLVLLCTVKLVFSNMDLIGEYQAFTESEQIIELTLYQNHEAKLFTGYLSTYKDEPDDLVTYNGSWNRKDEILILDFKGLGILEYEICNFLPYSEFGAAGGSFGLKPSSKINIEFRRFGLWKKSSLKKFLGNSTSNQSLQ